MNTRKTALVLGLLGLVSIATSNIVEALDEKIAPIAWMASSFFLLEMIYLRSKLSRNPEFEEYITSTNPFDFELNPQRYLNWMTFAMIIGLMSTIIIWYNFILGMISYLLMQICLIIAFSGIFSLNPMNYWKSGTRIPLLSLIFWVVLVGAVYYFGVYSGSESLIVIPYVVFLGTMAHYTWYNFSFGEREKWFNVFPVIASAIFVFSDAMIGNARFGIDKLPETWFFFIDTTYVINLFFMINALLFVPKIDG